MTYSDRADKIPAAHHQVGYAVPKYDSENPCANESFYGFLGGQLDELGATERDPADVGEDIIGDYKTCGKEEPYQALEDVVHDEVSLHHDDQKGHVRPCELRELESEVASFQGRNEEHKT